MFLRKGKLTLVAGELAAPSCGRTGKTGYEIDGSAASILGLRQAELAEILGLSAATVSRMVSGAYLLDPERKKWQLAALLVRVYRSLDSITGGRDEVSRAWLNSGNAALGARPGELLRDVAGLVMVGQYLDASRAVAQEAC